MTDRPLGFETLAIHAGTAPDPATGARQVPIYQTTAYVFRDADHAAKLFNLQEVGYIYSRLTNPTVSALVNRVAPLEGAVGGVACSSGHAAQIMAPLQLERQHTLLARLQPTVQHGQATVRAPEQSIGRFGQSRQLDRQRNLLGQLQPAVRLRGMAQRLVAHPQHGRPKASRHARPGQRLQSS